MLYNGNFESDWSEESSHHCFVFPVGEDRYETDIGNIFTPPGWITWFIHDPNVWDQPEVRDARSPERVMEGDKAILLFTFFRKHDAGFLQQAQVSPGTRYRVTGFAHAWSNHQDSNHPDDFPHPDDPTWSEGAERDVVAWVEGSQPGNGQPQQDAKANFTFWIGIDPTGGTDPRADTVVWGEGYHIYNGYARQLTVEAVAEADTITVFLRSTTLWAFKHNDAYWDGIQLKAIEAGKCRGHPRAQYKRTYVLLPPGHDAAWAHAVVDGAWDDKRYTIGGSADDAGIGDLDVRRVIAVNPGDWNGNLAAFYAEHYPGIKLDILEAATPEELVELLQNGGNGNGTPTPRETRGHIGLHLQNNAEGVTEFVAQVKPAVMKCVFGFERAIGFKRASPETAVILRHYNNNSAPYIYHSGGPLAGARLWIDQFRDSLYSIAQTLMAELPDQEIVIFAESVNEVYATGADNGPMMDFNQAFCEAIAEMGARIGPVIFTAAVGNPGEHEYADMVPMARACEQAKGLMGYHNYWLSNPVYGGPDHLWQWLAGRWVEMDRVLVEHGVHVRWFGGESGAVGGSSGEDAQARMDAFQAATQLKPVEVGVRALFRPEDIRLPYLIPIPQCTGASQQSVIQWVSLLPYDGWKSNECLDGDWDRYLREIMRADELIAEWNVEHEDRYLGSVLFTTSGPGWDSFDIGTDEIRGIGEALLARYPELP